MAASPLVSVVMAVYNGEKYVREAIESILTQTFQDFEFIIIDDGSTDGTAAILAHYQRMDPRIRVARNRENEGQPASLNKGCHLAKGKYIARIDADDVALIDRFKKQVAFLDTHPRVAVLGGAMEYIDENGASTGIVVRNPTRDILIKRILLSGTSCIFHSTAMFRKDAFLAAHGYRRAFRDAEDYDLWLRMADHNALANLADCLVRYRIHPQQVSISRLEHQVFSALAAKAAADLRRRSHSDGMDEADFVTAKHLVRLGVSAKTLRRVLAQARLHWAAFMLHMGKLETALQLLHQAEDPNSLEQFARIYGYNFGFRGTRELVVLLNAVSDHSNQRLLSGVFYAGWARANFEKLAIVQGAKLLIRACAHQPVLVLKSIRFVLQSLGRRLGA